MSTVKQTPIVKKAFGFIGKTYELFQARFVPVVESGFGDNKHYLYGNDDLLPNNNLRLINDCGVAKRCIRKKARYIQADGFSNEASAIFPVNDRQKANDLLQHISSYAAYNEGFALQIRRNAEAKIVDVKCIPFECVRKKEDGTFLYNPLMGQPTWKKDKDTEHPAFNPKITVLEYHKNLADFKQQPEIFYVYEQTADNPYYPVPDYNAGLEDIETCVEISKMDLEITLNGFMPSGILTTHEIDNVNKDGKPDEDGNVTSGMTPYEYFVEELQKFTGQVKDSNGRSGRFRLMHVMVSNLAEAPKLEKYDAKAILEASDAKRETIAREVCRLFGVHPILVGFSDAAVLGNTQALANVISEFNNYVNPIQRMITSAMKVVFPLQDWTITQFNPVTYISAEVYGKMTDDEIRGTAGLPPLPKQASTTAENTLNALNSVPALVGNKILDMMTPDEMRALIGLPPLTPEQIEQLMPTQETEPPSEN